MSEIVYILTNQSFPENLIKIGRTAGNLKDRIRQLSGSAVPEPYECYFACEVEDSKDIESRIHYAFGESRYKTNREFFKIGPDRVKAILELLMIKEVTLASESGIVESQDDSEIIKNPRARRPNINFKSVDIPVGAELTFVDDETITCHVAGDRKVKFKGEEMFLNKATLNVLNEHFNRNLGTIQGPNYWLFEGEKLTDRRTRLEQSDDDADDDTC